MTGIIRFSKPKPVVWGATIGALILVAAECLAFFALEYLDKGFPNHFFVHSDLVGYVGNSKWRGKLAGIHTHDVSFNSYGFRDDQWIRSASSKSLLILGSSAMFGLGLEKNDRVGELIKVQTGRLVYNAAMVSFGPPHSLAALRHLCAEGYNFGDILYFHEYKMLRADFLSIDFRSVNEDGQLVNKDNYREGAPESWFRQRAKLMGLRTSLARFDVSLSDNFIVNKALRIMVSIFPESVVRTLYDNRFIRDPMIFENIGSTASYIASMREASIKCKAKFSVILLPSPSEHRFRRANVTSELLKMELDSEVNIIDVRYIFPVDSVIRLAGFDYFNKSAMERLSRELSKKL